MKPKLLILDDQPEYLRALERALKSHYDILTASCVEEAQEQCHTNPVAALVDIRLCEAEPDNREGLGFVQWLHECHPDIVSIAISALEERDLAQRAHQAGAAVFLPKPVRVSELQAVLQEQLEP